MNKPVKILWQAHEANLSGANIALLEYIDKLDKDFVHTVVLPHAGNMQAECDDRDIKHYIVPQYNWLNAATGGVVSRLKKTYRSQKAVKQISEILRTEQVNLVCTNTQLPFVASKAAHKLGLQHAWWIHEFGEEDFGFAIGAKAIQAMKRWTDLVICNSEAVKTVFQQKMPGMKIERFYQPVSWKGSTHRERFGKDPAYLMFGQIIASKGHKEVIEAVYLANKKGIHIQLDIVGPGEATYIAALHTIINQYRLKQQIHINEGYFTKEDIIPRYDRLILASRCEAFGRVIVEAQKAGLKTIVKNRGGAPELINDTNGLLYNDTADLVNILTGQTAMPAGEPQLAYDEADEIARLKQLLFKQVYQHQLN